MQVHPGPQVPMSSERDLVAPDSDWDELRTPVGRVQACGSRPGPGWEATKSGSHAFMSDHREGEQESSSVTSRKSKRDARRLARGSDVALSL